jgi:hypothetical protein
MLPLQLLTFLIGPQGELENITTFEEWQQESDRVVRNISEANDEETVKAALKAAVETAEK